MCRPDQQALRFLHAAPRSDVRMQERSSQGFWADVHANRQNVIVPSALSNVELFSLDHQMCISLWNDSKGAEQRWGLEVRLQILDARRKHSICVCRFLREVVSYLAQIPCFKSVSISAKQETSSAVESVFQLLPGV